MMAMAVATKPRKQTPRERLAAFEQRTSEIATAIQNADRREAVLLDAITEARALGDETMAMDRELDELRRSRETDRAALVLLRERKLPDAARAVEIEAMEAAIAQAHKLEPSIVERTKAIAAALATLDAELPALAADAQALAVLVRKCGVAVPHDAKLPALSPIRWRFEWLATQAWPHDFPRPAAQLRTIDPPTMMARLASAMIEHAESLAAEARRELERAG